MTWLLQVDFKEALEFIISFTNEAVEKYKHSEYGLKDVKEIILYIGEKKVRQYVSGAIWVCIVESLVLSFHICFNLCTWLWKSLY